MNRGNSDTVTVYPCGRTKVDVAKLFSKPHIKKLLAEMREKIVYTPKCTTCGK